MFVESFLKFRNLIFPSLSVYILVNINVVEFLNNLLKLRVDKFFFSVQYLGSIQCVGFNN